MLEFSYARFDMVRRRDRRCVQVVEGEASEVRFSDASGDWDLPLEVVVGDGSARQFADATRPLTEYTFRHDSLRVRLQPKPGQGVSYPAEPTVLLRGNQDRRAIIRDVSPGKYRMKVYAPRAGEDLDMGRIPVFEADIEVKPDRPPVRVELARGPFSEGCLPGP